MAGGVIQGLPVATLGPTETQKANGSCSADGGIERGKQDENPSCWGTVLGCRSH